jgi:serine/threonine-protein kinase
MAPEQARGKAVDKRADIWAFGVVLYEMLTGRRLFEGETTSDTLAAVLKAEPDWERVPAKTRSLLRACLEKDPKVRLRDIGDAWQLLEERSAGSGPLPRARVLALNVVALALAVLAAVGFGGWWRATRPVDYPLTRLSVDLGPEAMTGLSLTAAISPDGRRLVFPAHGPGGMQMLATRLLDQAKHMLLTGTENASSPFFSPDGQWIGFFADSQIKKVSVQGGTPIILCATGNVMGWGGSWGGDRNIIASLGNVLPLSRLPETGGVAQPLTKLGAGAVTHRWPQILPGGAAVLFTAAPATEAMDNASILAVSLKTGQVKTLERGGYYGRYLPSGHLVYIHQGVLFGVKMDVERLEVQGEPIQLLEDVGANPMNGGGQFDFSAGPSGHGTFLYSAGKSSGPEWQVAWSDGSEKTQPILPTPGQYSGIRISPDGRKLAFSKGGDIHIQDMDRDYSSPLTFTGHARIPVWVPDGRHIVFQSAASNFSLEWIRSNGGGEPQPVLESPNSSVPSSFSPDGQKLAYYERNPDTGFDIWILPLDLADPDHPKPGKPEPFLRTSADELLPRFSPDGHWIAYRSNELGSAEIFVRPFPIGTGVKWQISKGGALFAFWSNNGHELFYETQDHRIMVVHYGVNGDSFIPDKPRQWSDQLFYYPGTSNLDIAPDGKRFAVFAAPKEDQAKGSVHVTMLLNFFDELRRKLR